MQKRGHWWSLEMVPVWLSTSWQSVYYSLSLFFCMFEHFQNKVFWGKKVCKLFTEKAEGVDGKGKEYCTSPVILGQEILSTLPGYNARRMMEKAQEQRGQPLFLLKELPRLMQRSRQRRKCCGLPHVLRRDFRQSPLQLKNPNIHIQRWYMFCSFWLEGKSFCTGC